MSDLTVQIPGETDRLGRHHADMTLSVKHLHGRRRDERPFKLFMDLGPWWAERALSYEELTTLKEWAESALALATNAEAA